MSSPKDAGPMTLLALEALLREHGIEGALAERLRALFGVPAPREDQSSTRARSAFPATRDHRVDPVVLAAQMTQPARRAAREHDATPAAPPGAAPPGGLPGSATGAQPQASEARASKTPASADGSVVPICLIAEGGMGEVHRARDGALGRDLAMKVLHTHLLSTPRMRDRFVDEAQITAQLAHPSIPPVHALGQLADGRPYFTMKEVHGRTLAELIAEGALSEQRRLEIFQRVCEAVSYAHARGVIHCDLKPLNVMVGAFGEVLVMDWGVARLVAPAQTSVATPEPPVATTASGTTTSWEVAGTPAYMPPEQALGEAERIGPACDVYALGVMLFEILTGERPYQGGVPQLLFFASQGQVPPLPRREGSAVDEALDAIIHKAMRPDPGDRYPDASTLGDEVARWREGAMRREKALAIVREASEKLAQIAPMRERGRALRRESIAMLAALPVDAGPAERRDAWQRSDAAVAIDHDVALALTEVEQMLEAALVHSPGLPEPRRLLADLAFERHCDAESRRAWDEATRIEVALRAHDVGVYARYLEGKGRLSLTTAIPAEAELQRFVLHDRRLVLEPVSQLGATPIAELELPIGSYAVELRAEGRPAVRVPFVLRRMRDARFARDPAGPPTPIAIPEPGSLGPDEVYVPAGWLEGDASSERPDDVWVDGFVMQTFPVSAADLARFLAEPEGEPYRRTLVRDGSGLFRPDWPAVGLSWEAAHAYARWLAARTGEAWRLPFEIEWERAARGADGRLFPWGDVPEPAFAHLREGGLTPARPTSVRRFPYDVSPFGVRGLAGNVRDWCADPFVAPTRREGQTPSASMVRRIVRGGSYRLPLRAARTTSRAALAASQGFVDVGFRLVRS
jgi:serine/threonine-protein kinase